MSFFVDTSIVIASQLPDEHGHRQATRWLEASRNHPHGQTTCLWNWPTR